MANQYYANRKLINSYSKIRLYAIEKAKRRLKYDNALQTLAYNKKQKFFNGLKTFTEFQQNWLNEIRDQLNTLKLK